MAFLGRSNIVQKPVPVPWQGVALAAGTFGFSWWLQAAPGVPGRWGEAEPIDASALAEDVRVVVGDGAPRVVGSPAAAAGRDRIAARLRELGLAVERHAVRVARRAGVVELENLVARVPGRGAGHARDEARPARGAVGAIGVVAHSDSAPGSPGASDDGAGVAAVLAVARALRERPAAHDVVLVVTDGEERGLLGAQAFMAQHRWAGELRAVVNLDATPNFYTDVGPANLRAKADKWLAMGKAEFTDTLVNYFNPMSGNRPRIAATIAQVVKSDQRAFIESFMEMARQNIVPLVGKIDVPVLSILADSQYFKEYVAQQTRALRSHKIVMLPGTRHFVFFDDPATYYRTLDAFLANVK